MTNTNVRGSSYARRARKLYLLDTFGPQSGRKKGTIAWCWECGAQVSLATICVDRIVPGMLGGRYTRDNIRPHCLDCSNRQGSKLLKTFRKPGCGTT